MKGKAIAWQAPRVVTLNALTNAAILTSPNCTLFIADQDYELESVAEVHEALGTDGGGVTLDIVKSTGTQTAAQGTTMLASTFNLKATINTVVRKDRSNAGLSATRTITQIAKGDRIAAKFAGVFTAITGLSVTLVLVPTRRPPSW